MRLGVGSMTGANAAHSAPTVTLLGKPESKADTMDVFHPYARGYYHGAYGYGYRPWIGHYHGYGYARSYGWGGYYRPYAFYRPYYYGYSYFPSFSFSLGYYNPGYYYSSYYYPISARVSVVAPAVASSAPVVPYAGAPAYADPVDPMAGTELLPTPRPDGTFPYDGGPVRPVPMPDGSQPTPITPPIPRVNVPAINRVKAPAATPKIAYPAYGEELPRPKPATPSPIVVKYTGQK
jgi:hypothetical protein